VVGGCPEPGELTYNETNQELREAAMHSELGLTASTENPKSSVTHFQALELRPYVDWQRERQDIGKNPRGCAGSIF
jgi:hypothetical protein